MMQTEVRLNGLPDRPDNYVGGQDLLGATNWIIRDNLAIGIEATDSCFTSRSFDGHESA